MGTGHRYRLARERAASALLTYVDARTTENERALLDAAHALEAIAAQSRRGHRIRREPLLRAPATAAR